MCIRDSFSDERMRFFGLANRPSRGVFCRLIGNLFGCEDRTTNVVQVSDSAGVGQQFYAIFERRWRLNSGVTSLHSFLKQPQPAHPKNCSWFLSRLPSVSPRQYLRRDNLKPVSRNRRIVFTSEISHSAATHLFFQLKNHLENEPTLWLNAFCWLKIYWKNHVVLKTRITIKMHFGTYIYVPKCGFIFPWVSQDSNFSHGLLKTVTSSKHYKSQ